MLRSACGKLMRSRSVEKPASGARQVGSASSSPAPCTACQPITSQQRLHSLCYRLQCQISLINSFDQCKPLLPELHNCELHLHRYSKHTEHIMRSLQGRGLAPCTVYETRHVRASTSSLSLKKTPLVSSTPA